MEIDDFKDIWKEAFNEKKQLSDADIEKRLKLKSKSESVLKKIKRSYIFELAVFIIVVPVIIKALFDLPFTHINILIIVLITIILMLLLQYLIRKYLEARRVNLMDENMKLNLKNIIVSIEKYINFNISIFSKVIIFPLAMFFGLYVGIILGSGEESIIEVLKLLGNKIYYLIGLIIVIYTLYLLYTNRIYRALYGKYLDELKQNLDEFEDNAPV